MNNVEAKKGFLSFVATVAIAAGIYFSAYFAVNALNSKAQDNQLSYNNKSANSLGRPDTTTPEDVVATDSTKEKVEAPKEMAMAQDVAEDFSETKVTPTPTPVSTPVPTAIQAPAQKAEDVPLQAAAQQTSVFGGLTASSTEETAVLGTSTQDTPTQKPAVLAGTTKEATVGGTPTTGSSSMAAVIITGLAFVFYGVYLGSEKSRKAAIRSFERKIRERI